MKIFISLFVVLSLTCCESQTQKSENIKSGFITESGNYYWGFEKTILMKNIGDGGKIFGITDKRGKVLYQQPINITFSDYHKWTLYVDDKENAYFYNSDYSETKALIWNNTERKYDEIDFCQENINLPTEFIKKLLVPTSNFGNCKSLKSKKLPLT